MPDVNFSDWETLLSEIITGDALGVDRMDYLLRDSHHVGVAYGKFDHYRLVDTIRMLPASQQSDELALGVESGGLHSAEALLLARYFMFMQVYHHPVRMAYDFHLQQFLQAWLPDGRFSTDKDEHQRLTDNEVLSEIVNAARNPSAPGHEPASRIVKRGHFRAVYTRTREDKEKCDDLFNALFEACVKRYGGKMIHKSEYTQRKPPPDFPVLNREGHVESSHAISHVLYQMPLVDYGVILADPEIKDGCSKWLNADRDVILSHSIGGEQA